MSQPGRDSLNASPADRVNLDKSYTLPCAPEKRETGTHMHRNWGKCKPSALSVLNGLSWVKSQKAKTVTWPLILKPGVNK